MAQVTEYNAYGASPLVSGSDQLGIIVEPLASFDPLVGLQSIQLRDNFLPTITNAAGNGWYTNLDYNSQLTRSIELGNSGPLNQPGQVKNTSIITNSLLPQGFNQMANNGFLG